MSEHTSLRDANVARQAEWDEGNQISLSFRGNELAGEVGEACNVIKKLDRERMGIKGSRDTVQHLAEELADVVICSDLIAAAAGVDLDGAIRDKFNATSEKHGFKTRLTGVAQAPLDRQVALDSDGKPVYFAQAAGGAAALADRIAKTYDKGAGPSAYVIKNLSLDDLNLIGSALRHISPVSSTHQPGGAVAWEQEPTADELIDRAELSLSSGGAVAGTERGGQGK